MQTRFHLAFPVNNIGATAVFYQQVLSCTVGRQAERWVDLDFHGHQLSAHLVDEEEEALAKNEVDAHSIPVRHFGLILPWQAWHDLRDQLQRHVDAGATRFLVEPYIRFAGQTGEQATMFIVDPSENALEFKAFRDEAMIFAR